MSPGAYAGWPLPKERNMLGEEGSMLVLGHRIPVQELADKVLGQVGGQHKDFAIVVVALHEGHR